MPLVAEFPETGTAPQADSGLEGSGLGVSVGFLPSPSEIPPTCRGSTPPSPPGPHPPILALGPGSHSPASRGPPTAPRTPPRSPFRMLKRHLSHGLTGPWPLLGDRQCGCGHPGLPTGNTKGQRGPQPSGPTGHLRPGRHPWVSTESVSPANSLLSAWWPWGYPAPPRTGR